MPDQVLNLRALVSLPVVLGLAALLVPHHSPGHHPQLAHDLDELHAKQVHQ